jgi:hypothetical protein
MLATGIVPPDLSFQFTRRTWTGYTGFAEKGHDVLKSTDGLRALDRDG